MQLHMQSASTAPDTESVSASVSYFHSQYIAQFFLKAGSKTMSTVRVHCVKEKEKKKRV